MNDVSVISPMPVQIQNPVTDGSMDELKDVLVPVQEEDLPQGVLDLLAALVLRHRPMIGNQGAADVVRDKAPPALPMTTMIYPQANRPIQQQPPQLTASKGVSSHKIEMPAQVTQGKIEPDSRPSIFPVGAPTEHSPNSAEPLSIERAAVALAPTSLSAEPELPDALLQPPVMRHTATVVPPSIPAAAISLPIPASEVPLETLPAPERGLLQVPFNKGTVSGQVTISRVPDEAIRNLQLSPSNALVFEQLKEPFAQVREPAWRLTDSGGEQQRQGSQQSPDDEQDEQSQLPA